MPEEIYTETKYGTLERKDLAKEMDDAFDTCPN